MARRGVEVGWQRRRRRRQQQQEEEEGIGGLAEAAAVGLAEVEEGVVCVQAEQ